MAEVAVSKAPAKAGEFMPAPRWLRPLFPFPKSVFGMNPFEMMDRFFEAPETEAVWYPVVECKRTNGELMVTADLPGMNAADVKVELTDEALILEGERKQEEKVEKEGYFRSERSYGKFYREIPLPEGAKGEEAKAEMANGVLTVKMPVVETAQKARQIPVAEPKPS